MPRFVVIQRSDGACISRRSNAMTVDMTELVERICRDVSLAIVRVPACGRARGIVVPTNRLATGYDSRAVARIGVDPAPVAPGIHVPRKRMALEEPYVDGPAVSVQRSYGKSDPGFLGSKSAGCETKSRVAEKESSGEYTP